MKRRKTRKRRSAFTSGINLGGKVHRTRRGKGSYVRKDRYNNSN